MKRILEIEGPNHLIQALHRLQQVKRGSKKKMKIVTSPLQSPLQRYQRPQNQSQER